MKLSFGGGAPVPRNTTAITLQDYLTGGVSTSAHFAALPAPKLPTRKSGDVFVCWRWWRCVMRGGEPLLQSTFKDTAWEGPIMRADKRPEQEGDAGLYGWFRMSAPALGYDDKYPAPYFGALYYPAGVGAHYPMLAEPSQRTWYPIAGEIELFGRCVVHEQGVRGEVARIKRLVVYPRHMPFCRPETITQLADRYDCPVEVGTWYDPTETVEEATP